MTAGAESSQVTDECEESGGGEQADAGVGQEAIDGGKVSAVALELWRGVNPREEWQE